MTNPRSIRPAVDFRDRSPGLVIFGAAQILMGIGWASLIPLTLIAAALSPILELHVVLSSLALYLLIAGVFVILGVGSIRARPWAAALSLSLAWVWLITGAATMVLSWWLLPGFWFQLGAGSGLDPGAARMLALAVNLGLSLIYVVLPGAFVLFYRSPNVTATCRLRNPQPDWTQRCPPRLLALAVAFALGGLSLVVVPAYGFVFPFFGRVLSGAAGAACWMVVFVLSCALARGTCRREPWAWWTAVAAAGVGGVSSGMTFAVADPGELLLGGLLPEQRGLLEDLWPASPWIHITVQALVWGSLIAYLFVVKPLFNPPLGRGEIDP